MKEKGFLKQSWARFKESAVYKILHFIVNSAAIALLITAILFIYQEWKEEERSDNIIKDLEGISENLLVVQGSLSTRYLGLFPGYIQNVNELLRESSPKDSVIIFEDVLYYGFLSRPAEFVEMNELLLAHADSGGVVTIVHYDEDGRTFHRMICESKISTALNAEMNRELRASFASKRGDTDSRGQMKAFERELCNAYFDRSRNEDLNAFKEDVERYKASLRQKASGDCPEDILQMCSRIDSVKTHWVGGKPLMEIEFYDYENMYRSITKEISAVYRKHGIELLPLNEYLTMSCWMAGNRAVLAFPSKWSSDEIGFFSQDPAFAKYIMTMLSGVRSTL